MTDVNFALPDVTLILDMDGVIRNAALSNTFSGEAVEGWLGQPWAETVGGIAGDVVRRMVEDARTTGVSAVHEITQRFPSGLELAVEYATVRLGANAGLIAIGRNLQAVTELRSDIIATRNAIEHDVWRLREVATRYRLLFDLSNDPVLLIGTGDLRIVEGNAAASRLLGLPWGTELLPELAVEERAAFSAMLQRVREQGKAPGITIRLGPSRQRWLVRASLIGAEEGVMLLQLTAGAEQPAPKAESAAASDLLEQITDGFVVVDQDGFILRTNQSFREMVKAKSSLVGQPLGRWLSRPGADMAALLAQLRREGAVRMFTTSIRTDTGEHVDIDISAAGNLAATPNFIGLLLSRREPAGRAAEPPPATKPLDRTAMRQLVREAISRFERECVEAARHLGGGSNGSNGGNRSNGGNGGKPGDGVSPNRGRPRGELN